MSELVGWLLSCPEVYRKGIHYYYTEGIFQNDHILWYYSVSILNAYFYKV